MNWLRRIRQWIKARGRWELVQSTLVWDCWEHTRTGDREAIWRGGVYAPVPVTFLRGATGAAWAVGPFGTTQVKTADKDKA